MHFARCLSSQKNNLLNNAIFVGVILLVVSSLDPCRKTHVGEIRSKVLRNRFHFQRAWYVEVLVDFASAKLVRHLSVLT